MCLFCSLIVPFLNLAPNSLSIWAHAYGIVRQAHASEKGSEILKGVLRFWKDFCISIIVKPRWGGCATNLKIAQKFRNNSIFQSFREVSDYFREVSEYFREVSAYFGKLVHIFACKVPEPQNKFEQFGAIMATGGLDWC